MTAHAGADAPEPDNGRAYEPALSALTFTRVDPAVKKADFILLALWALLVLAAASACAFFMFHSAWWAWVIVALLAVAFAWRGILIPLRYRNFGYVETDSEFIIRRGALFLNYEIIPYGRLQKVTVAQGPISRHCGISKLAIHTASTSTDGAVKGLGAKELERLRSELTYRCAATFEGV